jgi:hypothetical protein
MPDINHEPDLGYIFYPYEGLDHPGHPRMDVIIQEKPTLRHYDPQDVHFKVVSAAGAADPITIIHPWKMSRSYRVCAGRIIVSDRKAKKVEAFSFGGDLQIRTDTGETVCCFTSPAPIFPLITTHDLTMWITCQVEILLAQQNAHWDPQQPHAYEKYLACCDPFQLYTSCLQALQEKAAGPLYFEFDNLGHKGEHFVRSEIKRLKGTGEWPAHVPTPNQLFSM